MVWIQLLQDGWRDLRKWVRRAADSLLEVKMRIVGAEKVCSMAVREGCIDVSGSEN
jgi:hypothetical protein